MVRYLKVSDEVYEQVLRIQGFLQARDARRYTIDEVMRDLLAFATEVGLYSMTLERVDSSEKVEGKSPFKIVIPKEFFEEEGEKDKVGKQASSEAKRNSGRVDKFKGRKI